MKPKYRPISKVDHNISNDLTGYNSDYKTKKCRVCKCKCTFDIDGICVTCWNNGKRSARKTVIRYD